MIVPIHHHHPCLDPISPVPYFSLKQNLIFSKLLAVTLRLSVSVNEKEKG